MHQPSLYLEDRFSLLFSDRVNEHRWCRHYLDVRLANRVKELYQLLMVRRWHIIEWTFNLNSLFFGCEQFVAVSWLNSVMLLYEPDFLAVQGLLDGIYFS